MLSTRASPVERLSAGCDRDALRALRSRRRQQTAVPRWPAKFDKMAYWYMLWHASLASTKHLVLVFGARARPLPPGELVPRPGNTNQADKCASSIREPGPSSGSMTLLMLNDDDCIVGIAL